MADKPTTLLPLGDNRAMAAWWGNECLQAILRVVAYQQNATTDYDVHYAISSARVAWWHAAKARGEKGAVPNA